MFKNTNLKSLFFFMALSFFFIVFIFHSIINDYNFAIIVQCYFKLLFGSYHFLSHTRNILFIRCLLSIAKKQLSIVQQSTLKVV